MSPGPAVLLAVLEEEEPEVELDLGRSVDVGLEPLEEVEVAGQVSAKQDELDEAKTVSVVYSS